MRCLVTPINFNRRNCNCKLNMSNQPKCQFHPPYYFFSNRGTKCTICPFSDIGVHIMLRGDCFLFLTSCGTTNLLKSDLNCWLPLSRKNFILACLLCYRLPIAATFLWNFLLGKFQRVLCHKWHQQGHPNFLHEV